VSSLEELRWTEVPCALCGADRPKAIASSRRYAVPLRILRCGPCGHVYLSPRPVDEDLPLLYDEAYYAGGGDYTYADDRRFAATARIRADARLRRLETLVPPGRILEVGCSFGAFLLAARERGWEVAGVDLSPFAAAACAEAGLAVREGTLESSGFPAESFDAVYLSETVEHLPDPRATVRSAAGALRAGGILAIGTANHRSLARLLRGSRWGYYMPGHLQYFSARTLRRLLREEGVPVVRARYGDDRSLTALRAGRRAAGRGGGLLASLRDVVVRAHLGGFSLGAGMVLYGRRVR
jgi:SAM-dependent methyltransferase